MSNEEPTPTTISIYPADGLTAVNSGAVYSNEGQAVEGAGSWIQATTSSVVVPAGQERTVSFEVRVPASATPGDHLGAIVAQANSPQGKAPGQFQVQVVARVVTAVLVTVPGPAAFDVSLAPPSLQTLLDDIGYVVVPISDTGRLLGKPTLTVTLRQGHYERTVVSQVDTLLPGGTAHFPVKWPDSLAGKYSIRVCASGAGLPAPVCLTSTASIGGPTATATPTRHHAAQPTARSRLSVGVIILAALGGAVVLALLIVLAIVLSRRGRRPRHGRGSSRQGGPGAPSARATRTQTSASHGANTSATGSVGVGASVPERRGSR